MKIKQIKFETEMALIEDLKPHPRNYREHPEDQIEHLKKSIQEHGFYRNIVTAKDKTILAGHGAVKAAKELNYKEVPIIRLNIKPDDPRALKVLIGDNEIEQLAFQDDRLLSELLKELNTADDLLGTGFDEMMLANFVMVTRSKDEINDFNEAAHWIGMPEYEKSGENVSLNIHFRNEKDREKFVKNLNIELLIRKKEKAWTSWWPEKERDDLSSIQFEAENA